VVESVEKKWLDNWIKTDFKGGKKNKDLWLAFYELAKSYSIKFHWVKGHADNPYNNRCDVMATEAADTGPWLVDEFYEAIDPKQ
jgi:ribonuclease HI